MLHLLSIIFLFLDFILSISNFTIQVLRLALLTEKFKTVTLKKKGKMFRHKFKFYTHTLENIDRMDGCFPLFLVTLVLAGDSTNGQI